MKTDEDKPTKDDLEYYFGFNLKLLALVGLKCSLETKQKRLKFIDKLPTFMINIQGVIFVILQSYFIVNVWSSDKSLAIQIISQLFSNIQCISKGFLLAIAIKQMQSVFQEMQIFWKTYSPSRDIKDEILLDAHNTISFCKMYFFVLLSCIICYDVPPLFNFALQYHNRKSNNYTYDFSQRILLLKYPFEISNVSTYFILVFQEGFLLIISGIFWSNTDTLFAQCITHICLQFKILKYDISAALNHENVGYKIILVTFVRRHRDLLRICMLIEEVFSPIIFSTMLLSSLNLCVNVVGIRETISTGNYQETGIYVTILMNIFLQILFYCTFAEKISEETRSLANTIYNCKWTTKDYKLRFYIQLIIMRSQKPFHCTAYGFFPIGHLQLTSILNTAFSYYMMLQTMR